MDPAWPGNEEEPWDTLRPWASGISTRALRSVMCSQQISSKTVNAALNPISMCVTCYNSKPETNLSPHQDRHPVRQAFPGMVVQLGSVPTIDKSCMSCLLMQQALRCSTAKCVHVQDVCVFAANLNKYVPEVFLKLMSILSVYEYSIQSRHRHRFSVSFWPLTCHMRPKSWCCLRDQTIARGGEWQSLRANFWSCEALRMVCKNECLNRLNRSLNRVIYSVYDVLP